MKQCSMHKRFEIWPTAMTNFALTQWEQVQGSRDGSFLQVKDAEFKATGIRKDGPHNEPKHTDPRALEPHGHRPGISNPDGTPWLQIYH